MIKDKQAALNDGPPTKRAKQQDNVFPTTGDICDKHRLPLVLFCDETGCKIIVCHSCVILQHRDHKVKDLMEMDGEMKKEIDTIKNEIVNAIENNTLHTRKLNEFKNRICMSAQNALKKIKEEKKKLITSLENEAKDHTREVQEIRQNELKRVEDVLQSITAQNTELEEIKQLTEKILLEENKQQMDNNQQMNVQQIKELFKKSQTKPKDNEKIIKQYKTIDFEIASTNAFQDQVMGNVSTKMTEIDHQVKDQVYDPGKNSDDKRQSTTCTDTNASLQESGEATNSMDMQRHAEGHGAGSKTADLPSWKNTNGEDMQCDTEVHSTANKPKANSVSSSATNINIENIQSDTGTDPKATSSQPSVSGIDKEVVRSHPEGQSSLRNFIIASYPGSGKSTGKENTHGNTELQIPGTSSQCTKTVTEINPQYSSLSTSEERANTQNNAEEWQSTGINSTSAEGQKICAGVNSEAITPPSQEISQPLSATKVMSWQCEVCHLSSSPTGKIYIASNNAIEAFDISGNLMMQKKITGNRQIRQLSCHHNSQKDSLIVALDNDKIELRSGTTGNYLDRLRTVTFTECWGIYQDTAMTALLSGRMGAESKVIQCVVKNNSISKGSKQFVFNLQRISDIALLRSNNKKIMVIMGQQSIFAVDYENKTQLWKISEPMLKLNAVDIDPCRVCTDGRGFLFVTDILNNRVVVIDTQGKIKQEICKQLAGYCFDIASIPLWNKLIVTEFKDVLHRYQSLSIYV